MSDIYARIRELCAEKKVSINKFEHDTGLTRGSTAKWDKSCPSADKLLIVANYFNVTIDYLLGNTDIKNPSEDEGIITIDEFKELVKDVPTEELSKFLIYISQELDKRDLK